MYRLVSKWEGGESLSFHEFSFKSCTGDHLFACSWEPEGKARVNFIIVHGLGEHCGRYREFAEFLRSQGYGVYTYDYRGFGKSPGRRGHIRTFDSYFQDLNRFVQIINDPYYGAKTILLGHSLGGLIGLAYALQYPGMVDGFVISSPGLKSNPIPRSLEMAVAILNRITPWVAFKNRLAVDKLSHDPKIVEAYQADPWVHDKVTPRFYTEVQRYMKFTLTKAAEMRDPLLLLYAGDDQIVNPEGAREFALALSPDLDAEVVCYESMYHEILNEVDKERVWAKIDEWVKRLVK